MVTIREYLEVFEIFSSEILFVGELGKYFLGWLDTRRDFVAIQNNLKNCDSVSVK